MRLYTCEEAALRLGLPGSRVRAWFQKEDNPLAVLSGQQFQKVSGAWMIPEEAIKKYEEFMSSHLTIQQMLEHFPCGRAAINEWILKGFFKNVKKINKMNYVPISEIMPLTGAIKTEDIEKILGLSKTTVISLLNDGWFEGAFKLGSRWHAPKNVVLEFKTKYFPLEDNEEYLSPREASNFLKVPLASLRKMVENEKFELKGIKIGVHQSTYLLSKKDVLEYKQFLESLDSDYYTAQQFADNYGFSPSFAGVIMRSFSKADGVRWVQINKQYQKVVPKINADRLIQTIDLYRVQKPDDPVEIFWQTLSPLPSHLSETFKYFRDFFLEKQNTTRGNKDSQKAQARQHAFLCNELFSKLDKEITLLSDHEIQRVFKHLSTTNTKIIFSKFVQYLIDNNIEVKFEKTYKITNYLNERQDSKEIYSIEEFTTCYQYIKNVDYHLNKALINRRYAITWLYVALHFTNAWRSSDFLNLPPVRIDVIGIDSLDYFRNGKRLTLEEAQRIINQYASKRLEVSKTGALNKFLVNLDMVVPLATMIVICECHRMLANDSRLLSSVRVNESNLNELFGEFPFRFSSRKMNRSFLTHLFFKATRDAEHVGVALELTKMTRRHREVDTTAIYVQSTNADGPIDIVSMELCNRGHFGYLYHLLIEIYFQKGERESLEDGTKKIQEFRKLFSTPLQLEQLGGYLQEQQNHLDTLAIRIASMSHEELKNLLEDIYQDRRPGHSEHVQCITYPKCHFPSSTSCVGCPNSIPKVYLLISLKNELYRRIDKLKSTPYIAVVMREKTWIFRMLAVIQEAIFTFGSNYVESFIDLSDLRNQVVDSIDYLNELQNRDTTSHKGDDPF